MHDQGVELRAVLGSEDTRDGVVISGMDNAQKEVAERQLQRLLKQNDEKGIAELERHEQIEVLRHKLRTINDELEHLV